MLILATSCRKKWAGRKRKTIRRVTSWSNQTLLIVRCMKSQLLPKLRLFFSFIVALCRNSHQGTRREFCRYLPTLRPLCPPRAVPWMEISKIPTRQLQHSSVREREAFKKNPSKWEGRWGVAATRISPTTAPFTMAAEMHLWFWSPWVISVVWRWTYCYSSLPHPPTLPARPLASHKEERGGSRAFRQRSAPPRFGELMGFAYEDHSVEIQARRS